MSFRRRFHGSRRRVAVVATAGAAALWLLLVSRDGFSALGLLGGAAAAAGGALAASLLASGGRVARHDRPTSPPDQEAGRVDPVAGLLDFALDSMGLRRAVVWEWTDRHIRPLVGRPDQPAARLAEGDPLTWTVREQQPIRLEPGSPWPEWPAAVLPLRRIDSRGPLALTVEAEPWAPEPSRLLGLLPVLETLLRLDAQEARATDTALWFDRVLTFLEELPANPDPDEFPHALARAAAEIARAEGAVVASWNGQSGQVLARIGEAGGPAQNTYFGIMAGDLAFAARAGSTIRREPSGPRPRPLAEAGERWVRSPGHLAVVPLADLTGETRGLVAVWGEAPPAHRGIELLEAMGPLLALQLQHAGDAVRFRQRAHEDPLTGLANRAAFEERLDIEISRFHRYRRSLALLVLDLDRFKSVNDTYGHAAGDAVLERVGDLLRAATRDADIVARIGGEEMVVLMPETMCHDAADVAERIRGAIQRTVVEWHDNRIPVTVSVGVSACPECVDDPAQLLRSADEALYRSKREGRDRVTTAPTGASGG